jgi:hypothetical protein
MPLAAHSAVVADEDFPSPEVNQENTMNRIAYRSVSLVLAAVMTIGTLEGIAALASSADLTVVAVHSAEGTASTPQSNVKVALNAH